MKKPNFLKTGLKVFIPLLFLVLSFQNSTAQICIPTGGSSDQITGTQDGFDHELWNQNAKGTACMTLGSGCAFSGTWSDIENYLARRGFKYDRTKKHQDYGTFSATYNCTYSPAAGSSGNSYMGVYGWAHNPTTDYLVEYYILENWRNWNPSKDAAAVKVGSFSVDGGTYDIYTCERINKPSILGDRDFTQYFSIRTSTRNSGTISISDHFNNWESLGMEMGFMHEVCMLVEGYQNSGTFDFTTLDMTVSSANIPPTSVDLTPSTVTINVGQTTTLTATVLPANATDQTVTYSSDKPAVATVSSTGVVTGVSAGTANITVTTNTGGFTDVTLVTVSPISTIPPTSVDLAPSNVTINVGQTTTLTATVLPANATDKTVTYSSDKPAVATVSSTGIVTGVSAGTANITVTTNTGGFTDVTLVTVNPPSSGNTIVIRARGTQGGEHIDLLINDAAVNSGWYLSTSYQEFTAVVNGDGDINVQFDNDATNRDVQLDWVRVNAQDPRQAENMQYNTAAYANGNCGGGSYSEWMHCNGVIGFGKISDNFGGNGNNGGTGSCDIAVPGTAPFASINKSYTHAYVINNTANLNNVNRFTINWSLENNGLWDISYNTSDGNPNYYVSLMGKITQTLASSSPSMTISGSGISILDGDYWVTMDGDNLVLVDKSNSHSIYFSNSATQPCSALKSGSFALDVNESMGVASLKMKVYPNPSAGNISIEMSKSESITYIKLYDVTGKIVYTKNNITENTIHIRDLKKGAYVLKVQSNGRNYSEKIIVY